MESYGYIVESYSYIVERLDPIRSGEAGPVAVVAYIIKMLFKSIENTHHCSNATTFYGFQILFVKQLGWWGW